MRAVVGVSVALVVLAGLAGLAVGRRPRKDGPGDRLAASLFGLALLAAIVLTVLVVVLWVD